MLYRTNNLDYREVVEPAVRVAGLPASYDEKAVKSLFKLYSPSKVTMGAPGSGLAVVMLNSPSDVSLAVNALSRRKLGGEAEGSEITVEMSEVDGCDIGVEIVIPSSHNEESLWKAIGFSGENSVSNSNSNSNSSSKLRPVSISVSSNRRAYVAFETAEQASNAHTSFLVGDASVVAPTASEAADSQVSAASVLNGKSLGGVVSSHITIWPSYTVEIGGLSADQPASSVEAVVKGGVEGEARSSLFTPIRIDRSAILKFRRHLEIVPALNKLKDTLFLSSSLSAIPYHVIVPKGGSQYDQSFSGQQKDGEASGLNKGKSHKDVYDQVDKFSLRALLKDYLYTDPAMRFQIAKNAFERALKDTKSKSYEDIQSLLEDSSPEIKKESQAILAAAANKPLTPAAHTRLFELFLQVLILSVFILKKKSK